ncbi:MAG: histone deacetylase family protein, partial [Shinella sp.]
TTIAAYREALAAAIARIRTFGPDVLIVSLGVDTFVGDPVGGFRLETPDFLTIGADISTLGLKTLFVMEGGYAIAALGTNTANVITGFIQR